jgi:AcrR family transcriptional regulator
VKKQTEKQRAKRKQIVDAAISCFIEKGFHATSTAEICKAAGMSPGNLFHYYPTKNAIIEAIAEEDSQDYDDILAACHNDHADMEKNSMENSVIACIEKLLAKLIQLYNEPGYARLSIEIIAEASRNPAINKIFTENEKKVRERFAWLISKGVESGEIDKQIHAEQAAFWLMSMVDGAIGRQIMAADFAWRTSLDSLTYMIRKVFTP